MRRVGFGHLRSTYGLFASKPGFDVMTCTENQLNLSMSAFTEQILMFGNAVTGGDVIPLGLSDAPLVFLTHSPNRSWVGTSAQTMTQRPYPYCGIVLGGGQNSQATVTASTLTLAGSVPLSYLVLRRKRPT